MRAMVVCVLAVFAAVGFGQSPGELLERAETLYAEAVEASAADRGAARPRFVGVAAAYEAVIDAGVNNAALQRNLGNAHLAAGEVGEAILAYRRAQRFDPQDRRVIDALAFAREQVRTVVDAGLGTRAERAVLWWRGVVPRGWLAWAGLAGWGAAWVALLGFGRGPRARVGFAVGVVVAVVGLGSLAAEWALTEREAVVVVEDEVVARLGPGDAVYDAAFTDPVREGVEGVVVERRGEWARVKLRSGREAWLPGWALGSV